MSSIFLEDEIECVVTVTFKPIAARWEQDLLSFVVDEQVAEEAAASGVFIGHRCGYQHNVDGIIIEAFDFENPTALTAMWAEKIKQRVAAWVDSKGGYTAVAGAGGAQ